MALRGSAGVVVLGFAMVVAGCGGSFPGMRPLGPPAAGVDGPALLPDGSVAQQTDRSVIETGEMEITVEDPTSAADQARGLALAEGGRLERSDSDGDGRVRLVLRVPSGSLVPLVVELRGLGKVDHEELGTQDVTDELIDLGARLASLTAMRDRLRTYLDDMDELSDILEVERELARVQADIDSIQSRLQHLDSYVAMSELDVTLKRKRRLGPVSTLGSWIGKGLSKLFIL